MGACSEAASSPRAGVPADALWRLPASERPKSGALPFAIRRNCFHSNEEGSRQCSINQAPRPPAPRRVLRRCEASRAQLQKKPRRHGSSTERGRDCRSFCAAAAAHFVSLLWFFNVSCYLESSTSLTDYLFMCVCARFAFRRR